MRLRFFAAVLGAFVLFGIACTGDDDNSAASQPTEALSALASPTPAPTEGASPTPVTPTRVPVSPTPAASPTPDPTPEREQPFELITDAARIDADLLGLQATMQAAVDGYGAPGVFSVAVTDLQTGETVSVRGSERHLSGCVMNLFVLYQAALDVEAGRYDLETIDALVRATTWSSNAKTARDLYVIAGDGEGVEGVRRVHGLIASLGLEDVAIDHPPAFHEHSLGLDYNNWITTESTNGALAALWTGELIEGEMRDYLLEVLGDVKPGLNYLSAAVPEGTVSHKNGFFLGSNGFVDNDVGIVQLQRGDETYAYAFSFFSQQVPTQYGDIVLGQQLAAQAYAVMAERYPIEDDALAQTDPDGDNDS